MKESIVRELIRMQDLLKQFLPNDLWHEWAEANEKVTDFLQMEVK